MVNSSNRLKSEIGVQFLNVNTEVDINTAWKPITEDQNSSQKESRFLWIEEA
jgi:hypothetical protein